MVLRRRVSALGWRGGLTRVVIAGLVLAEVLRRARAGKIRTLERRCAALVDIGLGRLRAVDVAHIIEP